MHRNNTIVSRNREYCCWASPNSKIGEFCPSIDYATKAFLFSRTAVIENKRVENIYTIPLEELGLKKLKRLARWDR